MNVYILLGKIHFFETIDGLPDDQEQANYKKLGRKTEHEH